MFGLGVAAVGCLASFNSGRWWSVVTVLGLFGAGTATLFFIGTECVPCNSVCVGCSVPMPHPHGGYGANEIAVPEYLVLNRSYAPPSRPSWQAPGHDPGPSAATAPPSRARVNRLHLSLLYWVRTPFFSQTPGVRGLHLAVRRYARGDES